MLALLLIIQLSISNVANMETQEEKFKKSHEFFHGQLDFPLFAPYWMMFGKYLLARVKDRFGRIDLQGFILFA